MYVVRSPTFFSDLVPWNSVSVSSAAHPYFWIKAVFPIQLVPLLSLPRQPLTLSKALPAARPSFPGIRILTVPIPHPPPRGPARVSRPCEGKRSCESDSKRQKLNMSQIVLTLRSIKTLRVICYIDLPHMTDDLCLVFLLICTSTSEHLPQRLGEKCSLFKPLQPSNLIESFLCRGGFWYYLLHPEM